MKKKHFYLMSDVDSAIGNFSEIIFYALLKAKRTKSDFVLVRKYIFFRSILSKKLGFRQPRALYGIQTEYSRNNSFIGNILALYGGTYVFLSYLYESIKYKSIKLLNRIAGKNLFSSNFHPAVPSSGSKDLFNIHSFNTFSFSKEDESYWREALSTTFKIELSDSVQPVVEKSFSALGLRQYPWYVCLHVRTPFFYNSTHDGFRNSSIENYYDAIRYITALGGAVVRMGDPMSNLENIRGLINYPNTAEKSEEMDLHLIKNCKFYIGTNSGIIDTAFLFGVPVLGVNITSFLFISPYKKCDSFIYKRIFSKEYNRFLSFKESLNEPFIVNSNLLLESDLKIFHQKYELIENTPEEILQSVKNMFINLETSDYLKNEAQIQFEQHLQTAAMEWIHTEPYFKKYLDQQFRCATKLFFNGAIDADFASKNY
ncbi:TIGR04372 family glycosyltransferase [Sulfuricurvum sp.]|uniref:TIGR04372 family glycosyltransferase n=1 Tax=Sulfuricurvum sp. TaxID=2025608 RepID=UPI00286E0317|nr:TIGR04372 family glycosyltransferase [Sulfuricurvum sp.]